MTPEQTTWGKTIFVDQFWSKDFIFAICYSVCEWAFEIHIGYARPVTYLRPGLMEGFFLLYITWVFPLCPKFKMGL